MVRVYNFFMKLAQDLGTFFDDIMILKNCYLFQMFSYLSVTENDNFIFILSLTLICIGVNENFSLSLSVYLSVGLCRSFSQFSQLRNNINWVNQGMTDF